MDRDLPKVVPVGETAPDSLYHVCKSTAPMSIPHLVFRLLPKIVALDLSEVQQNLRRALGVLPGTIDYVDNMSRYRGPCPNRTLKTLVGVNTYQ
eukprot:5981094-Pyramimonas_sp.AAC.1